MKCTPSKEPIMMKNRANRKTSLTPLFLCLAIFCVSLLLAG